MKKLTFWLSVSLILIFWPLSFYLENKDSWFNFFLALSIIILDWILYSKKITFHYFLYLLLPVVHPAYLVFPFIALLFHIKEIKKIFLIIYSILLIFLVLFSWKSFYVYSIFTPDPLAFDTLSKKISLIPNRNLARVYENKSTIFQDKYESNIFISFDLNNYFFSLHPQEIGGNQNLTKYPYLAIIPFLLGLYLILENKQKKWIINTFLAATLSIAFINNQDRFDLIAFLPISLVCIFGLKKVFEGPRFCFWLFTLIFLPLSLIDLLQIIITK